MKILSFRYKDKHSGWELNETNFFDLTLLVGASGVGKTKILNGLHILKKIALGSKVRNIQWHLKFEENEKVYIWEGDTFVPSQNVDNTILKGLELSNNEVVVQFEKLTRLDKNNMNELFKREDNKISFKNQKVPKLHPSKSCIDIFSDEEDVKKIINGFQKMFFFKFEEERLFRTKEIKFEKLENSIEIKPKELSMALNALKSVNIPLLVKIATTYKYFPSVFLEIKNEFINIFPIVQDIRFTNVKKAEEFTNYDELEDENEINSYELQITENMSDWIPVNEISSGMLKTLLFIGMVYLVPNDSVIFVDEFENSLGINCIDLSTNSISLDESIQYILTSHHPYIINKISMDNWKIVSRNKGKVVVKDAFDYDLGRSKHTAFKRLLNLDVYKEGRE